MGSMFGVRSARIIWSLSRVLPMHAACAASAPRPHAALRPALYARLPTRQSANSLSDANKLLIRCAWAGTSAFTSQYGSSWGPGSCTAGNTRRLSERADPASQATDAMHELGLQVCEWAAVPGLGQWMRIHAPNVVLSL
eukprot:scaffold21386_cov55-Phaeocystis_antarctica.AAC.1